MVAVPGRRATLGDLIYTRNRMLRAQAMKWCADCGAARSVEEFYAGPSGGCSPYCREHMGARSRAYERRNGELVNAWSRARRERRPEHYRALNTSKSQNRRARKRAQFVEPVDRMVVYERDAGICGVCGEPVSRDAFDVDHIVPLAAGGEHSYSNVRATHPSCNRRRPRNYVSEGGGPDR